MLRLWLKPISRGLATKPLAQPVASAARKTFKKPDSRKTYLVDRYTSLLRENPIVLVVHNSTLLKQEDAPIRQEIKRAGGVLTVVRSRLLKVALRGLSHDDPASKEANKLYRYKKHPLMPLVAGPSAIITLGELNPKSADKIIRIIDNTANKLILLGGQVQGGQLLHRQSLDEFRKLPSLEELRAQLAGVLSVLGGAGLTSLLESPSKTLYLTLKSHTERE